MNTHQFKGEWQQYRAGQWSKLTDADLAATAELVGLLQKRYNKALEKTPADS